MAPRSSPHHACVDRATLAAHFMEYNLHNTGFDLPNDAQPIVPEYIADTIVEYTPGRQLRSVGTSLMRLRVPRHNLERYDRRGVSVTTPRLWNDLPDSLRLFKSNFKTSF